MTQKLDHLQNANFPRDPEGRVYHLGVKRGEVANRILSVGDAGRAKMLSRMLDSPDNLFIVSNRGFTVYTGTYQKVPLSIIATGMGVAMIDFLVRECRAVIDGTMVVIRYGTCGTPQPSIPIGSVVVTETSVLVRRNPDHFLNPQTPAYEISLPVGADTALTDLLHAKLLDSSKSVAVPDPSGTTRSVWSTVVKGANASADSFYSSQGRIDPNFLDDNTDLINTLVDRYQSLCSLEMETFQLLHLARCSKRKDIRAGAAVIVLAQRLSNQFLDNDRKHLLEATGGRACLDTLVQFPLTASEIMNGPECVWNII